MRGARLITPVLQYREPEVAAQWLVHAFGAKRKGTRHAPCGAVDYIELQLGQGSVLICALSSEPSDDPAAQPQQLAAPSTQMSYLAVDDVEQHCRRAHAAGAKIESEPRADGEGGRFYICRDHEGHLWSFGTQVYGPAHARRPWLPRVLAGLAVLLAAGGWLAYHARHETPRQAASAGAAISEPVAPDQGLRAELAEARASLERTSKEAADQLERDRAARAQQVGTLQDELTKAARAREDLDRTAADLRRKMAAAEQHAKDGAVFLALEQARTGVAEDRLGALQGELAKTARAREDLDRASADLRKKMATAEQAAKDSVVLLALEQARTDVAQEKLGALQAQIEQTDAALAVERTERVKAEADAVAQRALAIELRQAAAKAVPRPEPKAPAPTPAKAAPPAPTACTLAAQGKVRDAASLGILCRGAEASSEPVRCYERLMSGQVAWGGGTSWLSSNALALCGGTHSASQTIECFSGSIASGQGWRTAIQSCR